jgi:HAE1 family hydrophobic/amphiphilic exporter-1
MVPLGTLVHVKEALGPPSIDRYNMYPAARLVGNAAPGVSSGQALQVMEQMAGARLPADMGYEWTGMSYQEKKVGSQGLTVFALAALVVFLILAAQYESWADPMVVVLTVPLALLGAAAALMSRQMDNNIYTQIGLVLLVGLAAKNAILIVEFARHRRAEGKDIWEAAVEGARLRFRPILMTSFAFILGVLPLVFARGAGAASRQAIGTVVCGGMTGVTLLGVIFTPVLYVAVRRLTEWIRKPGSPKQ